MRSGLFADDPLPRAFYHPTRQREVDRLKEQACLSSGHLPEDQLQGLDQRDRDFLKGGNAYTYGMLDTKKGKLLPPRADNSDRFDESWPESERPSTMSIPDLCETLDYTVEPPPVTGKSGTRKDREGATYMFQVPERDRENSRGEKDKIDSSTLSKYLERFRYGQPTSREEREKTGVVKQDDFWWLSKTSDTSSMLTEEESRKTSRRLTSRGSGAADRDSGSKGRKTHMSLAEYTKSGGDFKLHDDLRLLHDKADRLLEKTGSSSLHSSEPVVSTEGLGSLLSTASDMPSTVDETPYRPQFTKEPSNSSKPLNPETDILAQWRRNRKMELMKTTELNALHQPGSADLENKLAAFRKRLASTVTEAQTSGKSRAETKHTLGKTRDVGLAAIVRKDVKALQVDSECQTSPVVTPRTLKDPVPTSAMSEKIARHPHGPPATHTHSPVRHTHSPIASPSLPRSGDKLRSSGAASDVEPHLHLSCDIIPCPIVHTQRYHSDSKNDSNKQSRQTRTHQTPPNASNGKTKTDGDVYCDDVYGNQSNGISEESDLSFEMMKKKHLRLLREEQELRKQVSGSRSNKGRKPNHFKRNTSEVLDGDYNQPTTTQKEVSRNNRDSYKVLPHYNQSGSIQKEKYVSEGGSTGKERNTNGGNHRIDDLLAKHTHEARASDDSLTDVTELNPSKLSYSGYSRHDESSGSQRGRKGEGEKGEKDAAEKSGRLRRGQGQMENSVKVEKGQEETNQKNYMENSIGLRKGHRPSNKDSKSEVQGHHNKGVTDETRDGAKKRDVKMNKKKPSALLQQGHRGPRLSQGQKIFGEVPAPQTSVSDSQDRLPRKSQSNRMKGVGPRPLHSSPMPSLNSAIGQVVGEHLFMSSVSFASSVDSFRDTIHEQPELTPSQDENFEAALHSDGEEFQEDDILGDLRKRRHIYLQKLQQIDAVLSEKQ